MSTRTHSMRHRAIVMAITGALALGAFGADARVDSVDYLDQWHLASINAEEAWDSSLGAGVVVAVIDTGVDHGHPDFAGADFLPGVTVSNCRIEVPCGDGSREPDGQEKFTNETHGTLVAGLMAAQHNGSGARGIAPAATYLSVRSSEDGGHTTADLAAAFKVAIDHGAQVINLSASSTSGADVVERVVGWLEYTAILDTALDNDVLIIAAAGNNAYPLCEYPSSHPNVVCVTATDRRDLHAAYSSFGVRDEGVTIAAPGGSLGVLTAEGDRVEALKTFCGEPILTTTIRSAGGAAVAEVCGWSTDYSSATGTSVATPIVAGVAALVRSFGCSAIETRDILTSTAWIPFGLPASPPGYGAGIVDARAAVLSARDTCASN